MVTKRASPGKKTTRKAAAAAGRTDGSAAALETAESTPGACTSIDADTRRKMVAAEAYFRAERRGFTAGSELDDWVAAEVTVDSRLKQIQFA